MKKKADIWWGVDGELTLGRGIQNVILFLFFALLAIAVETISDRRNYVFMALCILPALVSLGSVVKLREGKTIRGLSYILYNGIAAGCFAFLFGLMGLEILLFLFQGKETFEDLGERTGITVESLSGIMFARTKDIDLFWEKKLGAKRLKRQ